jgi:hypothetical protein
MTLNDECVLLSSGKNSYVEQGLLVQDAEPSDCDNGVNLAHVQFATPTYATHRYERQFYA